MISRRQFLRWTATVGAIGALTGTYGFLVEPLWRLKIARYELEPERWPQGLELSIAALADIHACEPWMGPERIRSIVETTNALGADLIVLLGDYVGGQRFVTGYVPASEWAQALAGLQAPLGVHAILGNHEWWSDRAVQRAGTGSPASRRALEDAGIPVYENDGVRLDKSGHAFWLAGLGDQLAFRPSRRLRPNRPIGVDRLDATLAKVTDDAPVIALPVTAAVTEQAGQTLSLAPDTTHVTLHFIDPDLDNIGHTASVIAASASGVTSGILPGSLGTAELM